MWVLALLEVMLLQDFGNAAHLPGAVLHCKICGAAAH
jgi:hypothetical protein